MREERRVWIKGCAVGCGTVSAVVALALLAVTLRTCIPLGAAHRARSRLDDRFGPPGSFRPAPDGVVPPQRLDVFLEVRAKLRDACVEFEALQGKMRRVETLDEGAPPSGGEVAEATGGMASVAVGIAPFIGEFFERRNRALLDAGMGLGEYSYIYSVVYRDELHDDAVHSELFFEGGLAPEVHAVLRSVLANQLASGARDPEELEREIRLMTEDPQRLPWADGLPDRLRKSLAPYRERLDAAYCRATAGIAMDHGSRRALVIALY